MRCAVAGMLLLSFFSSNACAAFTDFSDFTQRLEFWPGDIIQSNGLSFEATNLRTISRPVVISANSSHAILLPGPGVEFLLPPGIQEISLYYEDGAGSAFAVNGAEPNYFGGGIFNDGRAGFSYFDGTTVGGVSISTEVITQSSGTVGSQFFVIHETGWLTLRGRIDSFVIAGVELGIDDITVLIPEPSGAASLIAAAAIAMITRRRRRN